MRSNPRLWLAALVGGLLVLYIALVSPKRALRCLPAAAGFFTRRYRPASADLPGPSHGNRVQLLVNGDEALPAMLALVDGAMVSVRMQVMLFFPDEAGMSLARALARAARRGVKVQLSFDIAQSTAGSPAFPYPKEERRRLNRHMDRMLEDLRAAGVEVRASPPGVDFALDGLSPRARAIQERVAAHACLSSNHYDHRKILVADGTRAVIGGMNVGNAYLYRVPPDPALDMRLEAARRAAEGKPEAWDKWLDAAALVEGPAAAEMVEEFDWRWEVLGGSPAPVSAGLAPVLGARAYPEGGEGADVRFLAQRPGAPQVSAAFMQLVREAKREIWAASPFVSYEPALRALADAARRGVRVVFAVPAERQEMPLSARLMRAAAPALVSAGVELYYNDLRMAHTKLLVVDGQQALVGSFNLNHRSFRHDLEAAVLVEDPAFAAEVVERVFEPYLTACRRVADPPAQPFALRDWLAKPFS